MPASSLQRDRGGQPAGVERGEERLRQSIVAEVRERRLHGHHIGFRQSRVGDQRVGVARRARGIAGPLAIDRDHRHHLRPRADVARQTLEQGERVAEAPVEREQPARLEERFAVRRLDREQAPIDVDRLRARGGVGSASVPDRGGRGSCRARRRAARGGSR